MQISTAWAQTAGAGVDSQQLLFQWAPLLIIPLIFYFLLFRPQQQRANELKKQQDSLRRGDRVVTAGGVIGTVAKAAEGDEVEVEIATGVRVRVLRHTISTVLARTEPAKGGGDAEDGADETGEGKGRRRNPAK